MDHRYGRGGADPAFDESETAAQDQQSGDWYCAGDHIDYFYSGCYPDADEDREGAFGDD